MSEEHIAYILKYTIKVSPYSTDYKHAPRHIQVEMAVYKTKGLAVHLSTAESIGRYFECKLNCSRICVPAISVRVTSNKILPGEYPRTLKYNLGPLLKTHAALFDVIRDGEFELVDANVEARPTTPWWPPIAAHRSIIVNNARAHKIYEPRTR